MLRKVIVKETVGGCRVDNKVRETRIHDWNLILNLELIVEKSLSIKAGDNVGPVRVVNIEVTREGSGCTSRPGHCQIIGSVIQRVQVAGST
jgi:hypothetical protein